ncbi:tetratricopeptide repeat protein, partial [Candidatus Sumerlaeota bacterium]|nr:tetratricopeptide repeat protein [Candidatus Sumerlaeota bacterium]
AAERDLKKMPEALADFSQALRINPQHEQALFNLISLRLEMKDYAGAQGPLEIYSRVKPEDPKGPYMLGFIEEQRGDSEKAMRYYRRALERSPGYAPAESGAARMAKSLGAAGTMPHPKNQ